MADPERSFVSKKYISSSASCEIEERRVQQVGDRANSFSAAAVYDLAIVIVYVQGNCAVVFISGT
jgi:hypothetical protein